MYREGYTRFRQYADDSVYHQDEFEEKDNSSPYYDDYCEIEVPDWLLEYLEDVYNATKMGIAAN